MRQPLLAPTLTALAFALAGCPSEETNPAVLWLDLDGVETRVRLSEVEPRPF